MFCPKSAFFPRKHPFLGLFWPFLGFFACQICQPKSWQMSNICTLYPKSYTQNALFTPFRYNALGIMYKYLTSVSDLTTDLTTIFDTFRDPKNSPKITLEGRFFRWNFASPKVPFLCPYLSKKWTSKRRNIGSQTGCWGGRFDHAPDANCGKNM